MPIQVSGQVGPQFLSDGTGLQPLRQGKTGELVVQELHGRFYEQAMRGGLFGFGLSNTALVAANAIATGLTATAQPVIGVWNPFTSLVNLVLLQAVIVTTTIGNTAVAPGGYMWVYSMGNAAISTGSNPINQKTLQSPGGAMAKAFAVSTALTGLTNNLVALRAAAITPSLNAAGAATAVSLAMGQIRDDVDGAIIVPPGAVVGIMNQVSTVTMNVSVSLLWEEVPW
jgi:hypothetical protein